MNKYINSFGYPMGGDVKSFVHRSREAKREAARLSAKLPQIGSRYFDVSNGDRGVVLVDGLMRDKTTRCMTGAMGWAEQYVFDSSGQPVLNRAGDAIKRRVLHGVVVFKPKGDE